MMRDAGASEVHFRVASPPTGHGCYYGVDTPERSKLLAGRMDVAAMCEFIHADSLGFVSIDGLYRAVGLPGRNDSCPQYCDACFTGDYPTSLTDLAERRQADAQLTLPVNNKAA
jgi:amidophosphoribosyltransferase